MITLACTKCGVRGAEVVLGIFRLELSRIDQELQMKVSGDLPVDYVILCGLLEGQVPKIRPCKASYSVVI